MRAQAILSRVVVASLALFAGAACGSRDVPYTLSPAPSASVHPVEIHVPEKLTSIETGKTDAMGRPARVACVTCHSIKEPAELPKQATELEDFHRGLTLTHGELSCASCHAQGKHDALRLASGEEIPMVDAMRLCGQCHGPQLRDYKHGSHGGMIGYWDRSRGPRARNHCVDCHDPHSPAYQGGRPVLPPRDRLLENAAHDAHPEGGK